MGKKQKKKKSGASNTKSNINKSENINSLSNDNDIIESNRVCSVTEYLEYVGKKILENEKDFMSAMGEFAFRGVSDSKKHILASGAVRKIIEANDADAFKDCKEEINREELIGVTKEELIEYHKQLVEGFKKKNHHFDLKNGRELSIFEILAEIQHFDGSTLLMDFTKNALVALFFAVRKHKEKDGKVFMTDYRKYQNYLQLSEKQFGEKRDFDESLKKLYFEEIPKEKKLYYWEAGLINKRIPAQHSIFILDVPVLPEENFIEIIIDADSKERIKSELSRVFDINEISLFDDVQGYAQYFKYRKLNINEKIRKAEEFVQQGEFDEAFSLFQEIKGMYSYSPRIHTLKAAIYYHLRKYDDAIIELNNLIKIDRKNPIAFYNRAVTKNDNGDFDGAIIDYNKAIELNPKYIDAYINRGNTRKRNGDFEGAITDYTRAIELDPDHSLAYCNRANTKGKIDDFDGAIIDYNKAIELNPKYATAYNNRGTAKIDKGDTIGAINDFTSLINLENESFDGYFNRGIAFFINNEHTNALSDFEKALELDPKSVKALNNKSHVLIHMGRYDEAMETIAEALEVDEKCALLYSNRAFANIRLGHKDKAMNDIKYARELIEKDKNEKSRKNDISEIEKVEEEIDKSHEEVESSELKST